MESKQFKVILATDQHHRLGVKNGGLCWSNKEDLRYFKEMTSFIPPSVPGFKNVLICGRKTWETLPSVISKSRYIFVVTNKSEIYTTEYIEKQGWNTDNVSFYPNFESALQSAFKNMSVYQTWVIGGASIYTQAFHHPKCGQVYWNKIQTDDTVDETNKDSFVYLPDTHFRSNSIIPLSIHTTVRIGSITGLETQYLRLIQDVLTNGSLRQTRNAECYSTFDKELKWDMADGFPLLTTKKMFWKGIVEELLFFIKGETQSKLLEEKGVRIWTGNTSREFLDSMGFTSYTDGEMGPMYGYQWRSFGKPYESRKEDLKSNPGIDQLSDFISDIKLNPNSRRILMTTYNPSQVREGVLYPCHSLMIQGYVDSYKRLCLKMYQRSADIFLGLPFNIASTSLLCVILAKLCDLTPGTVSITLGDAHIYKAHEDACRTQIMRIPKAFGHLRPLTISTLEDVEKSERTEYKVLEYSSHPAIRAPMFA